MVGQACITVDVEDWYEGMAARGHSVDRPQTATRGLWLLARLLCERTERMTFFVVGTSITSNRDELRQLVAQGHEIASHGPVHTTPPSPRQGLVSWLKRGRDALEDAFQTPVRGFRSPNFARPPETSIAAFRNAIAEAGFTYVSDTQQSAGSAVIELPVLTVGRVRIGGGSYQRAISPTLVRLAADIASRPAVLYYHSYDFGSELPRIRHLRDPYLVTQVVGRSRVPSRFLENLGVLGSRTCGSVACVLR
jgi:peptidoglycan/xylan/chitin deacetylase (PgdA/CDA1 family)